VLVRGPLHRGLLSGKYNLHSVFTDDVRPGWNEGQAQREDFERKVAIVDKLKQVAEPGEEMVTAALRFVISHAANPVAIPGAKSPQQARMNAAAGEGTLSEDKMVALHSLLS